MRIVVVVFMGLAAVACSHEPQVTLTDIKREPNGTTLVTVSVACHGAEWFKCENAGRKAVDNACPPNSDQREVTKRETADRYDMQWRCVPDRLPSPERN